MHSASVQHAKFVDIPAKSFETLEKVTKLPEHRVVQVSVHVIQPVFETVSSALKAKPMAVTKPTQFDPVRKVSGLGGLTEYIPNYVQDSCGSQ